MPWLKLYMYPPFTKGPIFVLDPLFNHDHLPLTLSLPLTLVYPFPSFFLCPFVAFDLPFMLDQLLTELYSPSCTIQSLLFRASGNALCALKLIKLIFIPIGKMVDERYFCGFSLWVWWNCMWINFAAFFRNERCDAHAGSLEFAVAENHQHAGQESQVALRYTSLRCLSALLVSIAGWLLVRRSFCQCITVPPADQPRKPSGT